jgi:hypothetical protein
VHDLRVDCQGAVGKREDRAAELVRDTPRSIDRNEGTGTTNCLPLQCENGLEQRHAAREIASLRERSGARLRRMGNGEGVRGCVAPGCTL